MNRAQRITHTLTRQLRPGHLELHDESQKHAGHAGANPAGGSHYRLVIESAAFSGVPKVKRHQMIYALLSEEFQGGLHALSIDARAPDES